MEDKLYNLFVRNERAVKAVYYSWWRQLQQQKDKGATCILQLFVDMTGFKYTIQDTDLLLLSQDANRLLEENMFKSPFERLDIMEDSHFLANFNRFWEYVIADAWKELLEENDWFNKSVMFAIALANSNCDECVMIGALIAVHFLPHLCMARSHLMNDIERVSCLGDHRRKSSLQKKQNYIDQICQMLIPDIKRGLQYLKVASIVMEQIFQTIIAFPELILIEYDQLDLISAGMLWKNRKVVYTALKCLKILMMDYAFSKTKEPVALFILKNETQLTGIMETFKTAEQLVLQLFLGALGTLGNIPLSKDTAEKIVLKMFGTNESVLNMAIDLHGIYYASVTPSAEVETSALSAIFDVFERYAFPLLSLNAVVKKLWIKGFFRKFDGLFEMLSNAITQPNDDFITSCTAHVIYYCHHLLMDDISSKISPFLEVIGSVTWSLIHKRMDSFVKGYPKCLNKTASSPHLYNLLLSCLNPENNELYSMAGVDCEAYYMEILFNNLSHVALNATSYTVLFHTLTTIYNFDSIAHITEDIWNQLSEKYYTIFFHTRSRLRSYNVGIDMTLMKAYTAAITRLCVLIEINNTSEHVFTLAEYLGNDLRLLQRMNLSHESEGIFYRLYKNALYAAAKCCLEKPDKRRPGIKLEQLGKRVQEFMAELIAQLNCKDCSFAAGMHVANALCNMLILTQETYTSLLPAPLKRMTYSIDSEVLQKLAIYIERHVFLGKTGSARKLMLATYSDVYRLHLALPQQTDTSHILKYYEENKLFAEELEQLLNILFEKNSTEFYSIVMQVIGDYCKKQNFSTKVKKFLSGLHSFEAKRLPQENETYFSFNIIKRIVDLILTETDDGSGIERTKFKLSKLLDILNPWAIQLPSEHRNELIRFIRQHENYSTINEEKHSDLRLLLQKFLKSLKK
uniref:SCD domain-containing protein n=1 Tax=Anopheles funestus TaxID=62324 RepID=A0A4Y0BGP6_ANOFN